MSNINNNENKSNKKEKNDSEKNNHLNNEDEKNNSGHEYTEQEQMSVPSKDEENQEIKNEINNDEDDGDSDNENRKEEEEEDNEDVEDDDDDDESEISNEMLREIGPYLQSKVNPNFNFPEVKDNTFVGKGLRRMKGYISIVSKEELEKKRIAFWGTRVEGDSQVWTFLKELCELPPEEDENIKAMLEANEIFPLKKCINVTYDKAGEVYEIPNYCINEPVSYDLPETHVKKPDKKTISFYVRKGAKQIKIKAPNTTSIEKVKANISKKVEASEDKIRMFYRGKEMKNGNELWAYNIEDDCVVQVMCLG
jgi:hypothetical protein